MDTCRETMSSYIVTMRTYPGIRDTHAEPSQSMSNQEHSTFLDHQGLLKHSHINIIAPGT